MKMYLFGLLFLAIALSGCVSQTSSVNDCDENWDCFEENLLSCEKAKVKSGDWEGIRSGVSQVVQPGETAEKWPTREFYSATKTSTMEITSYEADKDGEGGLCNVIMTDLNVKRNYLEGDPERGYTSGSISIELWKKASCDYLTNGQNTKEKEIFISHLYICHPLEKGASYIVPWEPKYSPVVKYFNLGETYTDGNLNITINSVEYNDIIGRNEIVQKEAQEGHTFAVLDIAVENTSKEEHFWDYYKMIFIDNGARGDVMGSLLMTYLENPLFTRIPANTTIRGQVAGQVQKDSNSLELEIELETGEKNFAVYKLK